MENNLLLLCGNDIPFEEAQLVIHPPTLEEIAYIGEESLWGGLEFLNFSKTLLSEEEQAHFKTKTDFEVLMSIINNSEIALQIRKTQMELVLSLLFPKYHILFTPTAIAFKQDDEQNLLLIDVNNFDIFKELLKDIFCLDQLMGKSAAREYNPSNAVAKSLVEKFKNRRKQLAKIREENGEDTGINILSIYQSIVAIGVGHDLNTLKKYTVFQLIDEFRRYQLKMEFDINMQAKMAGAKDLKEAENWMKNIHQKNTKDTAT